MCKFMLTYKFILAAMIISISGCSPKLVAPDDRIYIVNNSDKDVLWETSSVYMDTIGYGLFAKHNLGIRTVPAKSKITMFNGVHGVNDLFDPRTYPSGILNLFIYDAEKVKNTPDNMIQPNEFVLKRYVFTKDSIEKIGRIIVYP